MVICVSWRGCGKVMLSVVSICHSIPGKPYVAITHDASYLCHPLCKGLRPMDIFKLVQPGLHCTRGVLVLSICVQILVRLACFPHSITMEVWKPARWKTVKIHRNKHPTGSVLVFLKFWYFSCELKETGSSDSTECGVLIGNVNGKDMKNHRAQTPHNLGLTKILQKFRKTSTLRGSPCDHYPWWLWPHQTDPLSPQTCSNSYKLGT